MQVVAIYYWIYGEAVSFRGGSNIPVHSFPPPRQLCTGIILPPPPGSIVLGAVMFLYTGTGGNSQLGTIRHTQWTMAYNEDYNMNGRIQTPG